MSNEDVVHRAIDAWNRRDRAALRELSHPDIEYVNSPTAVEPGTRHGLDAWIAVVEQQWEILAEGHHRFEAVLDRGDDIVTLGRVSRAMPGSASRVDVLVLMSWTIRDGKVARLAMLGVGQSEVDEARRAAGLDD